MPYIKDKERRRELDEIVERMQGLSVEANGDLNYILYAFCVRYVKEGYNSYKNYRGELRECADEIRRRMLAKYEDRKKRENGDVY